MEMTWFLLFFALFATVKSAPFQDGDDGLTYPIEGMKEFKIEWTGSGLCINSAAKFSICEDKGAETTWKWNGNKLQNVDTDQCFMSKKGLLTVDDCSLIDGKKKHKIFDIGCSKKALTAGKNRCLKVTENNTFSTVHCKNEKPSAFKIYFGKPLSPAIVICALKYDLGKRTNDPQYYYVKNNDFKITWVTKYIRLYVVYSMRLTQTLMKKFGDEFDAKIQAIISDGVAMVDKAYRQINLRVLLGGYEVWKDHSPVGNSSVYGTLKGNFRNYTHYHLREHHDFEGSIFFDIGKWLGGDGKSLNLGGAGMSDLCKVRKGNPKSEMFIMAKGGYTATRFPGLIIHELGHQIFQGHNFEPGRPCPFYRMFGSRCAMGGNDYPKGFSKNFFTKLQSAEKTNVTACVNAKPNLQKTQSPRMCGNGIVEAGEECDCGSSKHCLTSHPCCDGMICKLKAAAECSNGPCCLQCKRQTTGSCSGPVEIITNRTGVIASKTEFNVHRHWKIVAKPGERIALRFYRSNMAMDFHINCSYDYIEVRDGGDETAPLLGKYCAAKLTPRFLKSTSHEMFITFHSDSTFASVFRLSHFILHPDSQRIGSFGLMLDPYSEFTACTRSHKNMKCNSDKMIAIQSAFYGLYQSTTCKGNAADSCQPKNVTAALKKTCEGKKFCKVRVKDALFGNHCPGVSKGLRVRWKCVPKVSSPEKVRCIVHNKEEKSFQFKEQVLPCKEKFRWLGNNILYHEESKMCVKAIDNAKPTYDCYSSDSGILKGEDEVMKVVGSEKNRCLQMRSGRLAVTTHENSCSVILFD